MKKDLPCPVYHQLPDTLETQFARELTDMQSLVRDAFISHTINVWNAPLIVYQQAILMKLPLKGNLEDHWSLKTIRL